MRQLFFALSAITVISLQGCSGTETVQSEKVENVAVAEKVLPNRMLTLEIEGMVCEKGCGSSIRKELKSTGAVANCSFDFEEERKANVAKIAFDKNKITADEIIKIVSSMNEKQFSVTKSETVQLEEAAVSEEATTGSNSKERAKINVSETSFEMPNLLRLFSRLISRN